MSKGFVTGSLTTDAIEIDRGGWVIGSFFPDSATGASRHTGDLEIKYWEFEPGSEGSHGQKLSGTTEWSLILEGSVVSLLDGEEISLESGDYALIHPGTPNNLVHRVTTRVKAITVKAPSDPSAKQAIEE